MECNNTKLKIYLVEKKCNNYLNSLGLNLLRNKKLTYT